MRFVPATRMEFAIWPLAPEFSPVRPFGEIWQTWMRRLAIRHLRRELSSLPDWLLYDIGINRTDIPAIVVEIVEGNQALRAAERRP